MAKRAAKPADARPAKPETRPSGTWKMRVEENWAAAVLAVLAVCRSWVDGITWPIYNTYFLWAIILCFAVWAMRATLRGGAPLQHGKPMALFGAFMAVAFITAFDTVQLDATYRTYLFWLGHFFLFVLATNAIRTRTAVVIVLTGFVVAQLSHGVYSLLHLWYVLPYVREQVAQDPALMQSVFGQSEMNAELAHRLNVNRAFGVFLFPNALAAFLIAGIPFALSQAYRSVVDLRTAWRTSSPAPGVPVTETARKRGLVLGTAVAALGLPLGYFLYTSIYLTVTARSDWGMTGLILWAGLVPLVLAAGLGTLAARRNVTVCGLAVAATAMPVVLAAQSAALWYTFSRGGILALVLALGCGAVLIVAGRRWRLPNAAVRAAAILLCAATVIAALHASAALAQNAVSHENFGSAIKTEGIDLTAQDLANPASFTLRVSYWASGLDMALDNFWSGVGLGNFGTVYPRYQRLGAGDVKTAHNDYLQAWCETGIFGLLAFCGIWVYFVVWGARRILAEPRTTVRATLLGLYCSVLAILIHALVDFDFFNPSLVFFVFLLAGLFYTYGAMDAPRTSKTAWSQYVTIPLLVLVGLTAGASVRAYISDALLTSDSWRNAGDIRVVHRKLRTAQDILETLAAAEQQPEKLAALPVERLATFITSRQVVDTFGELRAYVSADRKASRVIPAEEPVPAGAFVVVRQPAVARELVVRSVELWLDDIRVADSVFPHNPATAGVMYQANLLLQSVTKDPSTRQTYLTNCVEWAKRAVERSPEQSWYHDWLGRAYWTRGKNTADAAAASADYIRGTEELRRAKDLYPNSGPAWRAYGNHLVNLGKGMIRGGDETRGRATIDEGRKALERAAELGEIVTLP